MGKRTAYSRFIEPGGDQVGEVALALRPKARPLATDRDLDPVIERIGESRFVLLGEATHGTHEFYTWRARLTRRLVVERGFTLIAVEGDWTDFERVDAFVRGSKNAPGSAREALSSIDRWPTWMWANQEMVELCEWLRSFNHGLPERRRVSCHGLDVYGLWESMAEVVRYLELVDPEAARAARGAYECFAPFDRDEETYARATALVPETCEQAVVEALVALRKRERELRALDEEAYFLAEQNARVAREAERYYRAMVRGGPSSWNIRDEHMADTLDRLVAFRGPASKAIVWAHNTHVGDARFTDMAEAGEINLGQLVRTRHVDDGVTIVGFATHRGEVIAADEWGEPMRTLPVPAARPGSLEDALVQASPRDAVFVFDDAPPTSLLVPRGQRAIGVVYHPDFERFGNYVPTSLAGRYDALLWVVESHALSPLHPLLRRGPDLPETYPSGL